MRKSFRGLRVWARPAHALRALALFFLLGATAWAQPEEPIPGANLRVAVVTFGPGEEVWERYGHDAIEIRDTATGLARLYNYGMFDFAQPDFLLNFARGRMSYRLAAGDPDEELPMYAAEGRWVVRQELNLTPAQRAKLAEYLDWNVREENAQYRYDYFRANCATRVRDALDLALGGSLKTQLAASSRGYTYRMDADRLMRPEVALMLAIDAGLGPFADQRLSFWDESFVPMELMRHLRDVRTPDEAGHPVPLVAQETVLLKARLADPQELPPRWTRQAFDIGLMLAFVSIAFAALRQRAGFVGLVARVTFALSAGAFALVCGIGGITLLFLWFGTDHVAAWRNANLLLFDPLCLLLLPAFLGSLRRQWRPSRFATGIALIVAVLAGMAGFARFALSSAQDNDFWIALLLPWHVALAALLVRQAMARA